jgi:hypothetical protein
MVDVTVVIPIAPHHETVAERAIASVKAQTVPVTLTTMIDQDRRGPGYVRNELAKGVTTRYIVFLDADDWLEPHCIEQMLKATARKPGFYIYSDWFIEPARYGSAPDCAWVKGTWHIVTALIPTDWFNRVGGFNESLPGLEDTEFFLKLTASGCCGVRLPYALVHYSADGQRSRQIVGTPLEAKIKGDLIAKYGGKQPMCCGQNTVVEVTNGERQPGDVLAQALWHGNHVEMGRVTRRHYPRMSFPKMTHVDPRDVRQSPNLWRLVEQQPAEPDRPIEPDFAKVLELARQELPEPPKSGNPAVNRIKSRGRNA